MPMSWDELGELTRARLGARVRTRGPIRVCRRSTPMRCGRSSRAPAPTSRSDIGDPCASIAYPYGDYDAGRRRGVAAGRLHRRRRARGTGSQARRDALATGRRLRQGRRRTLPRQGLAGDPQGSRRPSCGGPDSYSAAVGERGARAPRRTDRHGDPGGQPRRRRVPARPRHHAGHLRRPRPAGHAGGARPVHVGVDPGRLRDPARRLGDARRPDPPRGPARRSRIDSHGGDRSGPASLLALLGLADGAAGRRLLRQRHRHCCRGGERRHPLPAIGADGAECDPAAALLVPAPADRRAGGDDRLRHRLDHRDLAGARRLGPRDRPVRLRDRRLRALLGDGPLAPATATGLVRDVAGAGRLRAARARRQRRSGGSATGCRSSSPAGCCSTSAVGQLQYANRIVTTPYSLLIAGISYVVFPAFARIASDRVAVHARVPAVPAMVRPGRHADRHDPRPARGAAGDHRLRRALEPRRRGHGGDLPVHSCADDRRGDRRGLQGHRHPRETDPGQRGRGHRRRDHDDRSHAALGPVRRRDRHLGRRGRRRDVAIALASRHDGDPGALDPRALAPAAGAAAR